MTEHGFIYSRRLQDISTWGMQLLWKFFTVIILTLIFLNVIAANENLSTGPWKGTFLTHDGTLYKIEYIVSYDDESEKAQVKIKMIYLDLGSGSETTYHLSDIKIEQDQLQFKIPKQYETKECTLEKKGDSYSGTCLSNAAIAGETSEITMVPAAIEPPDTE